MNKAERNVGQTAIIGDAVDGRLVETNRSSLGKPCTNSSIAPSESAFELDASTRKPSSVTVADANESTYRTTDDVDITAPDSAIDCRSFSLSSSNNDDGDGDSSDMTAFFRNQTGRNDDLISKKDLGIVCQNLGLSVHSERELFALFDRLDGDGCDGEIDLRLFVASGEKELEMATKRMHRESSPATLLLRQKAATVGRNEILLFSFLSTNGEGLIKVDALRDLWQNQLDGDDPDVDTTLVQTFLDSLSDETGGTVSAMELAKNMERFLLEAADSSPATQTFRKLAIGGFKYEIDYLRSHAQNLAEERNKCKADGIRLMKQKERLIREAEEHKEMMHVQHQALVEAQRKGFEEQFRGLRNESFAERELMAGQHQKQMQEIGELVSQLRLKESQMKEDITNLKYDNSNLEGELLDARAEMNASKRTVARLRQELAAAGESAGTEEFDFDPSSMESSGTMGSFLREMNASLKDQVDELTTENEQLKQQLQTEKRRKARQKTTEKQNDVDTPMEEKNFHLKLMNRQKSGFGLQRRMTASVVESSTVDEAKQMAYNGSGGGGEQPLEVKRPSVIGAENDRPKSLMIETMVIPTEEELVERRKERFEASEDVAAVKSQLEQLKSREGILINEVTRIKSTEQQVKEKLGEILQCWCERMKEGFDVLTKGLESRCSALSSRCGRLMEAQTLLKDRMEVKQNRVVRSYEKEIAELEECLISMTEEHGETNDKLQAKCRQLQQQYNTEKTKVEELTKKINSSSPTVVQLRDKSYTQLERNRRLLREKDGEIKRLKQALNETTSKSRDCDGKHKKEMAQLKDAMLQMIVKQGEMEDGMKSKCEQMADDHAKEVTEFQKKIEELRSEKEFIEESIKGSHAQIDETYRRQTSELQERVVRLKEERAFLEGESQARAEMEEHYRKAVAELQTTIACLEEEKQMLENHAIDLEARWQKTAADLRRRLELMKGKHQREIDTLKSEHESQKREIGIKVAHLQQTLDALTIEKDAGEKRHQEELSEANEEWTNQLQRKVKSEKSLLHKTATEYQSQMDEAATGNRQLKEVLWRLKKEKTDVEKSLNRKYEELEEDAERQAAEMMATIDRLQKEKRELAEELLDRCRDLKGAFKTECREMERALDELNADKKALKEQNTWLERVNRELSRQNEEILRQWERQGTNQVIIRSRAKPVVAARPKEEHYSDGEVETTNRIHLKSIEMRNSVRASSAPPAGARELTPLPLPLPIPVLMEEARKLKITVTDTTAAKGGFVETATIIYNGSGIDSSRFLGPPKMVRKRIDAAEQDLTEVRKMNNFLTDDKRELLQRISTVRKELSRLSAGLHYNPIDGKRAIGVLEQTNAALQAKVNRLEIANKNWIDKLKEALTEKREAVETVKTEESKTTNLLIKVQKLVRERDLLKRQLEDVRQRVTEDTCTSNATIKLKRPKIQGDQQQVRRIVVKKANVAERRLVVYADLNNQLKDERATLRRIKNVFKSDVIKVTTTATERKDDMATRQKLKALQEQKTALKRVLERVCAAALETPGIDGVIV
eukprot:m.9131 g.9131  ORF g.9131 m.9131 type:complete len:1535 (+) comp21105_c0_seq2:145-4749(+)